MYLERKATNSSNSESGLPKKGNPRFRQAAQLWLENVLAKTSALSFELFTQSVPSLSGGIDEHLPFLHSSSRLSRQYCLLPFFSLLICSFSVATYFWCSSARTHAQFSRWFSKDAWPSAAFFAAIAFSHLAFNHG